MNESITHPNLNELRVEFDLALLIVTIAPESEYTNYRHFLIFLHFLFFFFKKNFFIIIFAIQHQTMLPMSMLMAKEKTKTIQTKTIKLQLFLLCNLLGYNRHRLLIVKTSRPIQRPLR